MTILRIFFALLIAGNLALIYANYDGFWRVPGGEPERLSSQLHPEKLRLIKVSEAEEEKPAAASAPATNAASAPLASVVTSCVRLAGLTPAQAEELGGKAKAAGLRTNLATLPKSWWVHLPQQADRASAEKKAGELQRLGVKDYFIDPANAISLGLFKSEEAARRALDQLKGRGVQSAQIDVRGTSSVTLELAGAQNLVAELASAASTEFTSAQRGDCIATH